MVVRNALQANETDQDIDSSLSQAALGAVVRAARAAAAFIRDAASGLSALEWVEKGTADFVTEVDRGAEARIAEILAGEFPDSVLVGEELSPDDELFSDNLTFITDPLDGTTNFLHAYPHYAVSIGAMKNREMIAAVVLNVQRGDIFTALKGGGAMLDGEPVRVSATTNPSRCLIGTGFPFKSPELLETYSRQFIEVSRHTSGIRRAGSAALDLADVACGRFDGFWELVLAPWDVAAGVLLIREAGGVVTSIDGTPYQLSHGPVVAGNPDIHPWLLKAVQAATAT